MAEAWSFKRFRLIFFRLRTRAMPLQVPLNSLGRLKQFGIVNGFFMQFTLVRRMASQVVVALPGGQPGALPRQAAVARGAAALSSGNAMSTFSTAGRDVRAPANSPALPARS